MSRYGHLAECEGCTTYLAQVRQTIDSAGTLRANGIEPTARDDLLSAFRAFQGRRGLTISAATASVAVVLVAVGAATVVEILFLNPILVGGGKRALPDKVRARLQLLDERRFRSGVVHIHYRISV